MGNEYETEKGPESVKASTAKSTKKRKQKPTETKNGDKRALFALVAIAVAFSLFIIMTIIQNKIIHSIDQMGVVVAVVDVPEGVILTEENMANYFTVENRASADIPAGYYTSGYALVGKIVSRDIRAKEIVTSACLISEDFYAGIEDPVEISIAADKIGQAVGGSLRAGDIINIKVVIDTSYYAGTGEVTGQESVDYSLEGVPEITMEDTTPEANNGEQAEGIAEETGTDAGMTAEMPEVFTEVGSLEEMVADMPWLPDDVADNMVFSASGRYASVTVCENVRVVNVYTAAGLDTAAAEADGSKQVATVINVVVPKYMEDAICLAQEDGTLRISRVIDVKNGETVQTEQGGSEK